MAVDGNGDVLAEFPGPGLWRYQGATGWQQLAAALAINANGDVAGEFSNGLGRFEDAGGWQQLSTANASQVSITTNGDVLGEFQGYGV